MSEIDDLIRNALKDSEDDGIVPPDDSTTGRVVSHFLRHSRWVAGFAWMKMAGTMTICLVAAVLFFASESTRTQIACAALFVVGFVGFGMWWTWYWMMRNRNDSLRELKRLELQIAGLREA